MKFEEIKNWLRQGERRRQVIIKLKQPMTALQLSKHTGMPLDCCSYVLNELSLYKLLKCMNPQSKRSRLYWLTNMGRQCQKELLKENDLPGIAYDFPNVDWELYGWICYSHRAAIIRALTEPLQPAAIKRRAKLRNPDLKMSANNVRDVIKLFLQKGIVEPVKDRKKAHLKYELTELGEKLQNLLMESGVCY